MWLYAGDHGGSKDGGEKSWVFWQSIDMRKLIEGAGLARYRLGCKDWIQLETRLQWFSPRSQCVIIWIPCIGLFVFDLKSMQTRRAAGDSHGHIWPYEIDLTLCFIQHETAIMIILSYAIFVSSNYQKWVSLEHV